MCATYNIFKLHVRRLFRKIKNYLIYAREKHKLTVQRGVKI